MGAHPPEILEIYHRTSNGHSHRYKWAPGREDDVLRRIIAHWKAGLMTAYEAQIMAGRVVAFGEDAKSRAFL